MTIQICKYNKVILFDSQDWSLIQNYTWCIGGNGYAHSTRKSTSKNILMHRLICGVHEDEMPQVDHINRNKLDNRRVNLRLANRSQNGINTAPRGKRSKFKGVYVRTMKRKDKSYTYIGANIMINKKQVFLGHFDSEKDAAIAYNDAAKINYGEFAYLNKID